MRFIAPYSIFATVKIHKFLAFLVSAGLTASIWAISPSVTGHSEPWDADSLFYFAALAVTGLLSGMLIPKSPMLHYFGSVTGQIVYEIFFLDIGPLFLLGIMFLLAYSLIFLAGMLLGNYIRQKTRQMNDRTPRF